MRIEQRSTKYSTSYQQSVLHMSAVYVAGLGLQETALGDFGLQAHCVAVELQIQ